MQTSVEGLPALDLGFLVQFRPQGFIGPHPGDVPTFHHSFYVKSRTSHQERHFAPGQHIIYGRVSQVLIPSQGELLIGVHDVNQVVGHALAFLGRWFICADVHAPVDLP